MSKKLLPKLLLSVAFLLVPGTAFAASNPEVASFTHDSMIAFISLASVASIFFLIRGGYLYITSTGNSTTLEEAKKTIKQALIGLVIVIGASVLASLLDSAMTQPADNTTGAAINMSPIQPAASGGSLIQIIIDTFFGILQNIIQTSTKPIFESIAWFLTNTPILSTNSVVFNFWLTMVGITDSLFVLVIALLGFHVMSASTFGFEELSLKELLPRIALAFVGASTSIFLIDWIISLCQTLIHALLSATGGLGQAWIITAFDPAVFLSGNTALVTLIFMIIFILLAVFLLIFYIARLMLLAFGAVISPLVCLIWLIPKFSDMAGSAVRAYFVTIFSLFIHVVLIQLASAFITIPGQSGENPVASILVGIALFVLLLKSTSMAVYLFLSSQATGGVKAIGGQLMNVISGSGAAAAVSALIQQAAQQRRPK
ncbi:MAG TPA: hypothetical protein PK263_02030 [bacterium]|nr:hypothetical protein [bacterium]